MKAVQIILQGRVQGVFFRSSAEREARTRGLRGYAKNVDDGSVLIRVEGNETDIDSFLTWAKRGPRGAGVTNSQCSTVAVEGYTDFKIL